MAKYFSRIIDDHWTIKNAAHEKIRFVARDMDRRIIDHTQIIAFGQEFKTRVDEINKRNRRCKDLPLKIKATISHNKIDYCFSVPGNFILYLFKAKD